jgi:phosphate transport system ATP-binding protein
MITAQVATEIQLRPGEDERSSAEAAPDSKPAFEVRNLSIWYGQKEAIHDVTIDIPRHNVTAIIGPSGCGKSTFLRCLNRMHELVPNTRVEGKILFQGEDLYSPAPINHCMPAYRNGFPEINPFPTMSIEENVS